MRLNLDSLNRGRWILVAAQVDHHPGDIPGKEIMSIKERMLAGRHLRKDIGISGLMKVKRGCTTPSWNSMNVGQN